MARKAAVKPQEEVVKQDEVKVLEEATASIPEETAKELDARRMMGEKLIYCKACGVVHKCPYGDNVPGAPCHETRGV